MENLKGSIMIKLNKLATNLFFLLIATQASLLGMKITKTKQGYLLKEALGRKHKKTKTLPKKIKNTRCNLDANCMKYISYDVSKLHVLGSEITLANACRWAMTNYPTKRFGIILWNHNS